MASQRSLRPAHARKLVGIISNFVGEQEFDAVPLELRFDVLLDLWLDVLLHLDLELDVRGSGLGVKAFRLGG